MMTRSGRIQMAPIKKSNDFYKKIQMTPIKNQMTSIKGWKQLLNFSTPLLTGEKVNGEKIKKTKTRRTFTTFKRRSRKFMFMFDSR